MKCEHNAQLIPEESSLSALAPGVCPVRHVFGFVEAAKNSNCGRSVMCRDGMAQLHAIIGDILAGSGQGDDLALIRDICEAIILSGDCEIALRTAKLVAAALSAFGEDWKSHVLRKRCNASPAGGARGTAQKSESAENGFFIEADVVVIGGGMSGLTASVAAAEQGASVVVFEKGGTVGGAANMGMGFFAVESKHQKAQLINHTVDGLFREFMDYTHWRVNAPLVKKLFRQSASTVEWVENMGVEFLGAYKYFENSNQTWHIIKTPGSSKPAERCASVMVKAMKDYADELGAAFEFHTAANEILKDAHGSVVGVRATDERGRPIEARCGAVIVSTGGFGDNPKMIEERMGLKWAEDLYSFRIPGLVGDGIRMVREAGGAIDPSIIEVTYTTPGVTDVFKTLSETMRQPNLMVNLKGRRIIDESIMNNTTFTGNAIAMQPKRKAFTIITDSILEEYRAQGGLDYVTVHHNIKNVERFEEEAKAYFSGGRSGTEGLRELQVAMAAQPQFYAADSLEELCAKTGIEYEALAQTIEEYNSMAGRYDRGFNKHPRFMRALKPGGRYYAAAHFICGYGTLAGIKTDEDLRVIDTNWQPVAGLYGCGTDVCSIFGDSYNFFMPGSTMGFAINSGRLAGTNAAKASHPATIDPNKS